MENDNSLGQRIYLLRTNRNETLESAAEEIGISHVSLMRYENGIRTPKADVLARIANHYGISVNDLVGSKEYDSGEEEPEIKLMARAMKMMTPEQRETMINLGKAAFREIFDLKLKND